MTRVLLVDDDATFRLAMAKALRRKGFTVGELSGGEAAIGALLADDPPGDPPDVVVLDLQMPGVSGLDVLRRTPRRRARVVVLTGHGTIPDAVEAMRLGAYSFLLKPIDADELGPVLLQAIALSVPTADDLLVGDSPQTRDLRALLDRLAAVDDPVLLLGETGTGKEVAASYLHLRSPRAAAPFLPVNLSCMPRELLESELFGHARGAFTGADRRKTGLFAEAGQGTLFLDEIAEMPPEHQPKLLRALEQKSFRGVGETREEPLRARLVVATNRDLREVVRAGHFRQDLYYRIAVLPVRLLPLRERPEDIVPIAEHWLRRLSPVLTLGDDARAALLQHDYPGNVRELVNVIRRVALFARGEVVDGPLLRRMLAEDPFRTLRPHTAQEPLAANSGDLLRFCATAAEPHEPLSLRELEIRHIERLLREHKNVTMVAKLLDIDRRTLQRKLRSLGIDWRED